MLHGSRAGGGQAGYQLAIAVPAVGFERLLPRWRGELLVLVLLGFAATGFMTTVGGGEVTPP